VTTADKIGLLPGFGWMAPNGSEPWYVQFLKTLLICWLITPYGHLLVGLIGEGRLIPVDSGRQFQSFWPGDYFLGAAVAALLVTAMRLPAENHFYNAWWWHAIILALTFGFAFKATYDEWANGNYPFWAIMGPSKWFHNGALYGLYGYVALSTFLAILFSLIFFARSWLTAVLLVVALLCAAPWVRWVIKDSTLGSKNPEAVARKAQHAHVPDWKFLGIIGPGSNWKFTKPSFR
jgi:hypothetical protein